MAYCEVNKVTEGSQVTKAAANGNQPTGTGLSDPDWTSPVYGGPGPFWKDVPNDEKCPVMGRTSKVGKCLFACKAKLADTGPTVDGYQLPANTSPGEGWSEETVDCTADSYPAVKPPSCFSAKGPYQAAGAFDGFTNLQNLGYIGHRDSPNGMQYVVPDWGTCVHDCDPDLCADYISGS